MLAPRDGRLARVGLVVLVVVFSEDMMNEICMTTRKNRIEDGRTRRGEKECVCVR